MTELLREEMGFTGLLFTDALRMGAITEGYGGGEAAVLALEAGADVILVPASVSGSAEALIAAVRSGRVTRERVDASVRRILEAKARVGLHQVRTVSLEEVTRRVGVREHREAADRVAALSITLPRDRGQLLPVDPRSGRTILSLTYAAPEDLPAGREFDAVLRTFAPTVESVRIATSATAADLTALLDRAASFDVILFNAYVPPRAGAGTVALSEPVRAFAGELNRRRPTILVSFGNPYLLAALPEMGSYLLAWGDREVSQRAAARAIVGAEAVSGRLPITLPGLHARGEGLTREVIPEVAAIGGATRDALDEAGLVRTREADADTVEGDGADLPLAPTPATPGPGGAGPTVPGPGGPGAMMPLPPEGNPAPPAWRTLPISPLEIDPRSVGMDPAALDSLDAYIRRAIGDSVSPGVAIAVGRRGELVRLRGYGRLDWDPASADVTPFSLYDLASLTKVVGTTAALMILVEEGRVRLEDPVVRYLPEFERGDPRKREVTVEDLLRHRSGLPAFRQFFLATQNSAEVRDAVLSLPLDAAPRTRTLYSDIGFMVLGWVVAEVVGEPLDRFLNRRLYASLGMRDTQFNPDLSERWRIAPTERNSAFRPYLIHGEVHDENAFVLGGVAGHAGLFSSAQDLSVFARLLTMGGMLSPCLHEAAAGVPCGARSIPIEIRFFDGETVARFTRRIDPQVSQGLGWDTPSGNSSSGSFFSARSFGHTGFTGTSIWIDPERDLFVVLLTNRVNSTRENTRHVAFRREVHDRVALAIRDVVIEPRNE
jgi:CubicO group peptidase (beta-lactamase class C family)